MTKRELTVGDLRALGIETGNMRVQDVMHNAGWYDGSSGKKLGWGDMNVRDLVACAQAFDDQVLVLLQEGASHWDFPKNLDPRCPPKAYLAKHCRAIVTGRELLYVRGEYDAERDDTYVSPTFRGYDLACKSVPRLTAYTLLGIDTRVPPPGYTVTEIGPNNHRLEGPGFHIHWQTSADCVSEAWRHFTTGVYTSHYENE